MCCGPEKDRFIYIVCLVAYGKAVQFKHARHEYAWPVECPWA